MIIGSLKDIARYKGISKNIDTAIDYVLNTDLLALECKKHIIDGDNVFINRQSYIAKELENAFYESHQNYIDLQIVLSGNEGFEATDLSDKGLVESVPYNAVKDVLKYENHADHPVKFTLNEGFAILFPEDIHMPGLNVDNKQVEKAVIKIKL